MTEHERRVAAGVDRISTSAEDVDSAWMARLSALSDLEVDSLLCGTVPPDSEDLAPIADMALALRRHVLLDDVPEMSDELRRQLTDAVLVPLAPRSVMRLAAVKAVAAAAAVAALFIGVGASQNRLPAGMQNAVSSVAELVGVEVPRADVHDHAPVELDRGRDDEGRTPGGATPADPGTPGDGEPATPATPPDNGNADPATPAEPDSAERGTVPEQSGTGGAADPVTQPAPNDGNADPATPPEPSQPGKSGDRSSAEPASQPEGADPSTSADGVEDPPASDEADTTGQSTRADPPNAG